MTSSTRTARYLKNKIEGLDLIGSTLVDVTIAEDDPTLFGLVFDRGDGFERVVVWCLRDDKCDGPGWLAFTETTTDGD